MFITDKIVAAFNKQIGNELSNSLQYIAITNWFESEDLKLIAKLYATQADEERGHAQKFMKFLIDSGAKVEIPAIGAVVNNFGSATEAAQLAYDAEVRTTTQIHDLVALSIAEKCPSATQFLQWFIEEQVEEIATAQTNLNIIKKAGNNVFMIEAYLAHGSA